MIPNPWVILGAVGFWLLSATGAFLEGRHIENVAWEAKSAAAVIKAETDAAHRQQIQDDAAYAADRQYWEDHPKIVMQTETVVKWAIKHVKDVVGCPGPDLIRVHNAAATGSDIGPQASGANSTPAGSVPTQDGSR